MLLSMKIVLIIPFIIEYYFDYCLVKWVNDAIYNKRFEKYASDIIKTFALGIYCQYTL